MTSIPTVSMPASTRQDTPQPAVADRPRTARHILRATFGLALLADALFYDGGPQGLALALWVALAALAMISLVWAAGRPLGREAAGWLAAAVLFAAGTAWRDAPTLQAFDFLATLASLAMAAIALNDSRAGLFAARLRDTIMAAVALAANVALGFLPVAVEPSAVPASRGALQRTVRAAVIAIPLVAVFGSLLVSADPLFASFLPHFEIGTVVSHAMLIGFFAWIVAGWARRALLDTRHWSAPNSLPISLDKTDVTVALGTVNGLFAAFVIAQIGWLFGGEAMLRARTGLTLATYARTGFFELVFVALLVVPLLVGSRALLAPGAAVARRHSVLAIPTVALVGAILLSAAGRLQLYVQYFGLTTDRFYPAVFMVWLGFVLVWLAVTTLRGWGRPFVAGTIISALATLATLNATNPDVRIAQANLDRGASELHEDRAVDVAYLATLSGDAVPLALAATLAAPRQLDSTHVGARCAAAKTLLDNWSPSSRRAQRYEQVASWRYASMGERAAVQAVAEGAPALRRLIHESCVRVQR